MAEYCMYLRKSRADLEAEARGEGETLARHQSILTELAKKQKLNVVKIYKEIVSGDSIAARPQMQKMLSDITDKKFDGVLVVEVERLARGDTIDQGIVAQAFKQSATKIITPLKTYDPDNEFDEEYFEFSLFMSRREYKTIKRRMQAGRLAAVKEGNYICSSSPYGYKKISPEPKVHTLEVIPHEAEIIKLIFKLYLDGHGAKFIAEELNRMGIRPRKTSFWESPSIKKILSNPLYCGKLVWKTRSDTDTLYQGLHQPIISEELFNEVQKKRLLNPAAQLHPNDKLLNYYHNILYCKNCGHQLKRRFIASSGCEHLLCTYRECRGKTVSSSFASVDDTVLSAFRFRIEQLKDMIKNGSSFPAPSANTDKKLVLEAELVRTEKQMQRLYDLLEQNIYDNAVFLQRSAILNQKISALKSSLSQLKPDSLQPKLPPKEAIIRLDFVIDNFQTADPQQKNYMLKSVARKIWYAKSQRMCRRNFNSDLSIEVDFL